MYGIYRGTFSGVAKRLKSTPETPSVSLAYIDNRIHNVSDTLPPDCKPAGQTAQGMGGTRPGDDQQEAENFCPATDIAMGAAGREPRGVEIP